MRVRDIYLAGLGVFLPEARGVPPGPASGFTAVAVAGELSAPEMALLAAGKALKSSGLTAEEIGLLLYATVWHQGPDGWGAQYYLQRHLLGDDLLAVEIRHGCNGVFSALELAVPYLLAGPDGRAALIAAADNFGTPLIDRWDQGDGIACLGDAATAVVVSTSHGWARLLSICTDSFSQMEEAHRAGTPLFPPAATTGTPLNYGARADLFQQNATRENQWLPFLLGHQKRNLECVARALDEAGVAADEITRVLIHGTPRQAATAYLKILGFPLEKSSWEFNRTVGHLGASDHLAALHHLLSTGEIQPGDHLLLCGFSPGLTYKAAVVHVLDVPQV